MDPVANSQFAAALRNEQLRQMKEQAGLISDIRTKFNVLQRIQFKTDITSEEGVKKFVKFIVDNDVSPQCPAVVLREQRLLFLA